MFMKSTLFHSKAFSIDAGLLLLRLLAGGTMLSHGWAKLQNVMAGNLQFADPIGIGTETSLYLAIFAEFLCALLLVLGFLTRIVLVPLMITMLVALLIVHAPDPFNVKELAFIYLGMFVVLFLTGPGKFSIDNKL